MVSIFAFALSIYPYTCEQTPNSSPIFADATAPNCPQVPNCRGAKRLDAELSPLPKHSDPKVLTAERHVSARLRYFLRNRCINSFSLGLFSLSHRLMATTCGIKTPNNMHMIEELVGLKPFLVNAQKIKTVILYCREYSSAVANAPKSD